MAKAIYAFSGDPITYGHIDIVERAAKIFDEVIVGIGVNPDKKYMFELSEREEMAKRSLSHLSNVKVVSFTGLLVDYAYENDIPVIIKGIRNNSDFDYEVLLHSIGESQKLGIETFLIPAKKTLSHISSSAVKTLQKDQGLIHEFVPLYVKQCIESKMSHQYIVGITGEIGAGKSFVCEKLIKMGKDMNLEVHNIDLDSIGHEILGKLSNPLYDHVRNDIIKEFGKDVKLKNGMINRKILGDMVFSDYNKLGKLNDIMRKPLVMRLRKILQEKKGLILFNAALIVESKMTHLCNDNIILVTCDKHEQERRLKERGLTKEQIKRRLSSQFTANEKKQKIEEQIKVKRQGMLWEIDSTKNNDKKIKNVLDEIIAYYQIYTK